MELKRAPTHTHTINSQPTPLLNDATISHLLLSEKCLKGSVMGTRYALMYLALTIERDPLNTLSRVKAITAGHKKRKSTTAIPATTKRQLLAFYYITVFAHLPLSFVSAQPTL